MGPVPGPGRAQPLHGLEAAGHFLLQHGAGALSRAGLGPQRPSGSSSSPELPRGAAQAGGVGRAPQDYPNPRGIGGDSLLGHRRGLGSTGTSGMSSCWWCFILVPHGGSWALPGQLGMSQSPPFPPAGTLRDPGKALEGLLPANLAFLLCLALSQTKYNQDFAHGGVGSSGWWWAGGDISVSMGRICFIHSLTGGTLLFLAAKSHRCIPWDGGEGVGQERRSRGGV